jgi:hypothetical protein
MWLASPGLEVFRRPCVFGRLGWPYYKRMARHDAGVNLVAPPGMCPALVRSILLVPGASWEPPNLLNRANLAALVFNGIRNSLRQILAGPV